MIHPHTELKFINPTIGYGVVATQFIPAGTITWVMDELDRAFTPNEVNALPMLYQDILKTYTFRDCKGNFILCWDNERYINHSFKSNCLTTAYDFEIAIRDIHPGEELTDDYGYLNLPTPFRGIDEGTKRKIVYPNDIIKYHKVWDKKVAKVFHRIPNLSQPLLPLLSTTLWEKIVAIANGKIKMDSILTTYYQPSN